MSTILVVDDEPLVAKTIGNFVARLGHSVLVTNNGNEALEMIKQNQPHLTFLDINIHGLKGLDVLKAAKQIYPDIKIAIITGESYNSVETEALQLGATAFLKKPFTFEDLQKVMLDCGIIKKEK